MSYTCDACGEEFGTLSRKRLHECPAEAEYGTTDDPELDVPAADMDTDDMAELAVQQMLVCDVCGEKNDGVDELDHSVTSQGVSFAVEFDCRHCGATNENTAVLE